MEEPSIAAGVGFTGTLVDMSLSGCRLVSEI